MSEKGDKVIGSCIVGTIAGYIIGGVPGAVVLGLGGAAVSVAQEFPEETSQALRALAEHDKDTQPLVSIHNEFDGKAIPAKKCAKCGEQYYFSECGSQICNPPRKMKCGGCSKEFLSIYGLFGYMSKCHACRQEEDNSRGRDRRRSLEVNKVARPPQQLNVREPLLLPPQPAETHRLIEQPAPSPVEATKNAKKTKRHGTEGRISTVNRDRLRYYAELRLKGIAHLVARQRTAQKYPGSNKSEEAAERAIQKAVRDRLGNVRDLDRIRKFLENISKSAKLLKVPKNKP